MEPFGLARFRTFLALVTLAGGCSHPGVERQRMPDGSFTFKCDRELFRCLLAVDDVCKGGSYEVLRAYDERRIYGAEGSVVEAHQSRAIVRCVRRGQRPSLDGAPAPEPAPVPAPAAAAPVAAAVSRPEPARARACVPGATQPCVGPAACSGGQACLPDGSGFGACDCGTAVAPAP